MQERRPGVLSQLAFWIAVVGACALFFVPAFIIRPFRYQAPRALEVAMQLKEYAPVATLIFALAAIVLAIALWKPLSRIKKSMVVVGLLLACGSAVMSRLNYFEWMFHPIVSPGFVTAAQAKLDDGEMVMAVRFGNDARAYPIVQMGYHHVFNDEVGGIPIAVTY